MNTHLLILQKSLFYLIPYFNNIYKDTEGYGEETHATYEDSKHRVNYLNWFMKQNKDVRFTFTVPDGSTMFNIGLECDNCFGMTIQNFNKHYGEQVVVEETKEASQKFMECRYYNRH